MSKTFMLSTVDEYGGLKYPVVTLKYLFPDMQNVGRPFDEDWHPGLGKISYRNIMNMFTYHEKNQS